MQVFWQFQTWVLSLFPTHYAALRPLHDDLSVPWRPGRPCGPPVSPWRSAWRGSGSPSPHCPSLPFHPGQEISGPLHGRSLDPLCKPEMSRNTTRHTESVLEQCDFCISSTGHLYDPAWVWCINLLKQLRTFINGQVNLHSTFTSVPSVGMNSS